MTDALVRHADHAITLAEGVVLTDSGCAIDHDISIEVFCSALQNVQALATLGAIRGLIAAIVHLLNVVSSRPSGSPS